MSKQEELELAIEELNNKMEIFAGLYESIEMDYKKVKKGLNTKPLHRLRGNMIRITKIMKLLRKDLRVYDALADAVRAEYKEKGIMRKNLMDKVTK